MYIKELRLKNFRNYTDSRLKVECGVNFIVGHNAAGKTNLLESIYFLENGKSHKSSNGTEIIKWNEEFTLISATVDRKDRELSVESLVMRNGLKQNKINGVIQKPVKTRHRPITTVLFTPDHLKIVKETPEHRRAYIDDILEKTKPDYYYWRQQYNKILKQRNMLLKRVFSGGMKKDVIDYWDSQITQAGLKIISARNELVNRLQKDVEKAYYDIAQNNESLMLVYENQLLNSDEEEFNNLSERYIKLLKQNRKKEIERGQTIIGPHRDDISIFIGNMNVRSYGSQGEQRSVALALKIGELSLLSCIIGDKPVLLLDDVMSELDETRRYSLFEHLSDTQQVLMTSANENYLGDIGNIPLNIVRIENGKIRRYDP